LVKAAGNEPFIAYKHKANRPPHLLPSTNDPPLVSEACELILVATSAAEVRRAIRLARPGPQNRVVVAGRGLDPTSGAWLTEVVTQESPALRVGALAGPAPVDEILNGGLCAGVIASEFDEVRQLVVEALHSSRYRVYESADIAGVQLAGAMMPVLATLLGLATNLGGAGVGIHGMVLARGLAEASRLGRSLTADPTTFIGLAGVGDLVAAQARPGHPHFEAGRALAKGSSREAESPMRLARALLTLARMHRVELPLTQALVDIHGGEDPLDAVQKLMSRKSAYETEGALR
jgi:glycerol-3-phosphate dehydrogenase (NAD(P)+)